MTTQQPTTLAKLVSVIGIIFLVIIVVGLAIITVRSLPAAFGTLASLADSVYHPSAQIDTLDLETNRTVVNTDDTFTVSWKKPSMPGSTTFNFTCNDEGVALSLIENATQVPLDCEREIAVNDTTELILVAESRKKRFVDLSYSVTFTPENDTIEPVANTKKITIVNPEISLSASLATSSSPDENIDTDTTDADSNTENSATTGGSYTTSEVIYSLPSSDPNGTVDLQASHKAVGVIENNRFHSQADISLDEMGAIQFSIKNIGTKTASNWRYTAILPSGTTYNSSWQDPLRPNEEAIITLGFSDHTKTGNEWFRVEVESTADVATNNNSFRWAVTITD